MQAKEISATVQPITKITHERYYEIVFYSEKANCLTTELIDSLTKFFKDIKKDKQRSFVVLKNFGDRVFCSGASFDELKFLSKKSSKVKYFEKIAKLFISIIESEKFVVAVVNGKSVGGGVGLVAVADYVIAKDTTAVKLSELSVGLAPFIVGPIIERKIGLTNLTTLSIACEWFNAEWCLKTSLYNEVGSELDILEKNIVNKLSNYTFRSLVTWRKALWSEFLKKNKEFKKMLLLKAKESGTI